MCIYILFILCHFLKEVVAALDFDVLSVYTPNSIINGSYSYNYGYWFKFQPLTSTDYQMRFGNQTNNIYQYSKQYLVGFEFNDENTLIPWHVQTDKFDHIVNVIQTDGLQSYMFQQVDLIQYEGRWNYFGIQVIIDNQYQIIFYTNQLKILIIDGQIRRKQNKPIKLVALAHF